MRVRRLEYEIRAEFRTASDERAGPGNEARAESISNLDHRGNSIVRCNSTTCSVVESVVF